MARPGRLFIAAAAGFAFVALAAFDAAERPERDWSPLDWLPTERPSQGGPEMVTLEFSADRTEVIRQGDQFVKRYEGDVVVRANPEVWLTADEATYSGIDHEVRLTGRVTINDSSRTLRADRMIYYLREHTLAHGRAMLWLSGHVAAADSIRSLAATTATYWPDADSIVGVGTGGAGVLVRQGRSLLRADTVTYSARTRDISAAGRVSMADSTQDVTIRGQHYRYRGTDSVATVSGRPVLVRGQGDSAVTVEADSMRLDERTNRAVAWDSVVIERGAIRGACDSVIYDDQNEELLLHGRPRAMQRTTSDTATTVSEAVGEQIVLHLDGNRVRQIDIDGSARTLATEYDSAGGMQGERWISGRRIVFHVNGEQVTQVDVLGQARSRLVPSPSARQAEGMNEASGDTMTISFQGSRMSRVLLRGGVQGIFWPPPDSTRASRERPAGGRRRG